MFNHEPADYRCPFCAFLREEWDDHNAPTDLVAQEELSYARIAPKWWPENPGSVLVIPTSHYENVYDIPADVGHEVWDLTRRVAVAMRENFRCEGISTRQHNEPAGIRTCGTCTSMSSRGSPATNSMAGTVKRASSRLRNERRGRTDCVTGFQRDGVPLDHPLRTTGGPGPCHLNALFCR